MKTDLILVLLPWLSSNTLTWNKCLLVVINTK